MKHRQPILHTATLGLLLSVGLAGAQTTENTHAVDTGNEEGILQTVASPSDVNADIILDTRPLSSCKQSTLSGAYCLPVEEFVAPQRRMANWSGMLWLLGTVGLTGNEHVLIIGEKLNRQHILGGLLALAGQRKVSIVNQPLSALTTNHTVSSGRQRSTTRVEVYTAPMRSDLILLRDKLLKDLLENPVILDGRTEAEYHGTNIRAQRGGHIPGAVHSPVAQLQKLTANSFTGNRLPISYAHDEVSGLAYFSALLSAGITSQLYTGGWVEWASNGALPADSLSYPQTVEKTANSAMDSPAIIQSKTSIPLNSTTLFAATIFSIGLVALGFFSRQLISGKHA
jgi:thiosulfate/3-mercaptopyruvate sulfurtransferase